MALNIYRKQGESGGTDSLMVNGTENGICKSVSNSSLYLICTNNLAKGMNPLLPVISK